MKNLSAVSKDWTELILRLVLGMVGEARLQLHWPPPQWGNLPFRLTLHWKWSPLVPFCLSKAWRRCGSSCSIWKSAMEKPWQERQDSRLLWAALISINPEGEAHCPPHWNCGENAILMAAPYNDSKNQGELQKTSGRKASSCMVPFQEHNLQLAEFIHTGALPSTGGSINQGWRSSLHQHCFTSISTPATLTFPH